jgi:5-methylcytosine-specific restriction endonuclease McrA
MAVFVLDKKKRPLMPCSEKRARQLLTRRMAVVICIYPFTIRLKYRVGGETQPVRLKLDPGSKTTGIAVVRENINCQYVLFLAELHHRGHLIRDALIQRRGFRRRRRGQLRYRQPRFDNRCRREGWLAPSLRHRLETTLSWVNRFQRLTPLSAISTELVRFDTQALLSPEISGIEYQQGTLAGYEVREYLLEKWKRRCAYCDQKDVPLEIDHIHPRSKGGSDRASNLTLACRSCNQIKGNRDPSLFLDSDPKREARIRAQSQASLQDSAAVNTTRWALVEQLKRLELPVETGSGGQTKWNRSRFSIPKSHALDAASVGTVGGILEWNRPTLEIKAMGRGSYQRTRLNRYGFPRGYLTRSKQFFGFQTGDQVCAEVPLGKKSGSHRGRVAVRSSGSFNIQTPSGVIQGVSHRYCRLIQRTDGYGYFYSAKKGEAGLGDAMRRALPLPGLKAGVSRAN